MSITISIVNPSVSLSLTATINGNAVVFLVDTGSALTILQKDIWERCKGPATCTLVSEEIRWCKRQFLQVFGSATVTVNIQGEIFQVAVVVVDPLTTEAILGLDVLSQCTVDLLHKKLITGAGHVVTLSCQEPNMEWITDLVNFGTVNSEITVSSELKKHKVSQQDLSNMDASQILLPAHCHRNVHRPQICYNQSLCLVALCHKRSLRQTVVHMCSWLK